MTEAEVRDLLIRVETAMLAEDCHGRAIYRVINRLVYGEPGGADARYTTEEGRTALQQRALAQAKAHEHALDRLQSELREAGEAYAWTSALAVRDAAMDLVAQLRDDLGEKDPDLIVGEVVNGGNPDDQLERYEAAAQGLRANLLAMVDADMSQPSHLKTAITGMVNQFADTVEMPTPLGTPPTFALRATVPATRPRGAGCTRGRRAAARGGRAHDHRVRRHPGRLRLLWPQ